MVLEQVDKSNPRTQKRLVSKIRQLQQRLDQAEALLRAIQNGEIDALVISEPEGERVYPLTGADRPYRVLVEEMNEGAMTLSPDGTLLYCNHRFAEILKLPLESVLGEPLVQFVAPQDQPKLHRLLSDARIGSLKEEINLLSADGDIVWVELSMRAMTIEGVLNLSAVAMDITARKHAEAALRASEERFAKAFRSSPLAISISTLADERIVEANASFSDTLGYTRAEVIGRTLGELGVGVDPEDHARMAGRLRERHSVRGLEISFRTKAREIRDGLVSMELIELEGEPCILSLIEDVTERKRAEQKLQESEEHFRLLLSGIKDYVIFMLDPAGNIASWNENAERVIGYAADEIIGNHFSILYLPEEIAQGKPREQLRTALVHGRVEDEDWRVRRDGSRFWASVVVSPLFDGQGNLRGFVKVTRDITRQKEAQEEIRAHAARAEALARVAARLNAELAFDAVLKTICSETCRALAVPAAVVQLYDEGRQAYVLAAEAGMPHGYAERALPIPRTGIDGLFNQQDPIVVIPDIQAASDSLPGQLFAEFDARTVVVAALWHKGERVGTLSAITLGTDRQFGKDELALFKGIADQAAQASANARLHEQVRRYAVDLERRVAERTLELELANRKLQTEISEHAQAEEALRASDERFRLALADSRITVFNQDRDLRYTWIHNPALGFTAEDLLGKTDAQVFRPDEAQQLEEIKRQTIETATTTYGEVALEHKGEAGYFDLTVEPQFDPAGSVVGITCVSVDVTERKRAEEALQQANQSLISWASELEQRNREARLLNEMGDLLQSCLTLEEAFRVIQQSGQSLFPDDSGALYVLDNSKNLAEVVAIWGAPEQDRLEHVFAPDNCWSLRRGRIHVVENSQGGLLCLHLDRARVAALPPFSYVCVPMVAQGEALGVFYLQSGVSGPGRSRGPHQLTDSKQQLAVSVAEHVALALSSLKLRETLHNQAIRDPLTGLFNRRYMEESLERELRRATRRQSTVGIIMVDLDHFKHFNDTFGHDMGDAILSVFGSFLQREVRGEDLACRYGGEEFTLILPEATLEDTRERAEQVRNEIKQLQVQHNGHRFGNLSISCGVAVFPQHGARAETILRAADAALYRAKADGRDRVVIADGAKDE